MQQDAQRVVALFVVVVVLLGAHLAQHNGVHSLQGDVGAPLGTGPRDPAGAVGLCPQLSSQADPLPALRTGTVAEHD